MGKHLPDKSILNLKNAWKYRFYFSMKLPSVIYWGIKLKMLDESKCTTTIPLKRTTKNPFKSIYFAALAGAAELSTGLLMLSKLEKQESDYSLLVVNMEMEFYKKAVSTVSFTCEQGLMIDEMIANAKGPVKIPLTTVGKIGDLEVAKATIVWSIKARQSK